VLRQPAIVWLVGIGGLFGYHFFYFTALKAAPPVDAGLICYLWPLLIVLLSGLLPGEKLRWHHVVGALAGLAGAALIVTKGGAVAFEPRYALGYGAAFVAAFVWAIYSLASRRLPKVPSDAVVGFCLATAALSVACHLALEETIWPAGAGEWTAVVLLGLFPVGLAFFVWDIGVKRGDIQVLGAASYAAPLLSTLLLVAFGHGTFTWVVALACLLISGGGLIAAKDMIFRKAS
jgi:drug/metabolite transporter (DMT)-like permease